MYKNNKLTVLNNIKKAVKVPYLLGFWRIIDKKNTFISAINAFFDSILYFLIVQLSELLLLTSRRFSSVANFGTNYFLLKIKILAKRERELTTKFAIARNGC